VRKGFFYQLDQRLSSGIEAWALRIKADIELQQQKQWAEGFQAAKEGLELDFGVAAAVMRMHYPVNFGPTRCGCGVVFQNSFHAMDHQVEMVRQAMRYPR